MKVEWLPAAERDREAQLAYLAERNPRAAFEMGNAITAAIERLSTHPHLGRPGRIKTTRELVITSTPYVIAYQVGPGAVVVLRLLHGAQRWPSPR